MPSEVSGSSVGVQADRDIKFLCDNMAHMKTKPKGDVLSKESKFQCENFKGSIV